MRDELVLGLGEADQEEDAIAERRAMMRDLLGKDRLATPRDTNQQDNRTLLNPTAEHKIETGHPGRQWPLLNTNHGRALPFCSTPSRRYLMM
jgi:hypothetical protein